MSRLRSLDSVRQQAPALPGLCGSMTALVTPFRGGRVDEARFSALCEMQVRAGTAALFVCGSTGEAAALNPTEQSRVLALAVEAVMGRIPVFAGCGAPATEAAVALAAGAARRRVAGLLCAPPPYSRPTQEGIAAHVRAVAIAAERPVVLYDVPARTGVAIADETVARLFDAGLIIGLKDATADLSRPPRLRALCGDGLLQFSGDDGTAAAHRAMGGQGCISVMANVVPHLCVRLHRAWEALGHSADLNAFTGLRDLLAPLSAALSLESNPIPIKVAMELACLCDSELRLPLTTAAPATIGRLAGLLPALLQAETASVQPALSLVQ